MPVDALLFGWYHRQIDSATCSEYPLSVSLLKTFSDFALLFGIITYRR